MQCLCDVPGDGVETTRQRAVARVLPAVITGHTTPALSDVGCASVRLRFLDAPATSGSQGAPLKHDRTFKHGVEDGGYLLAIQKKPLQKEGQGQSVRERRERGQRGLLAAICAVPGDKGLDRYENSRQVSARWWVGWQTLNANQVVRA